jgi:hypothetical protein
MSFWQRTLKIFGATPVRVEYRVGALGQRTEVVGEIEAVSETSCTLKTTDGSLLVLSFQDILVCEPVGKP